MPLAGDKYFGLIDPLKNQKAFALLFEPAAVDKRTVRQLDRLHILHFDHPFKLLAKSLHHTPTNLRSTSAPPIATPLALITKTSTPFSSILSRTTKP